MATCLRQGFGGTSILYARSGKGVPCWLPEQGRSPARIPSAPTEAAWEKESMVSQTEAPRHRGPCSQAPFPARGWTQSDSTDTVPERGGSLGKTLDGVLQMQRLRSQEGRDLPDACGELMRGLASGPSDGAERRAQTHPPPGDSVLPGWPPGHPGTPSSFNRIECWPGVLLPSAPPSEDHGCAPPWGSPKARSHGDCNTLQTRILKKRVMG